MGCDQQVTAEHLKLLKSCPVISLWT